MDTPGSANGYYALICTQNNPMFLICYVGLFIHKDHQRCKSTIESSLLLFMEIRTVRGKLRPFSDSIDRSINQQINQSTNKSIGNITNLVNEFAHPPTRLDTPDVYVHCDQVDLQRTGR